MYKLKVSFFIAILFITVSSAFAIDVLVANKNIKYRSFVDTNDLIMKQAKSIYRHCTPLTLKMLDKNRFLAKRYMAKGTIVCTKDVKIYKKESVVFNFGSLQIEKEGKVIRETDKYIRIRKPDGKTETIFKDGRID